MATVAQKRRGAPSPAKPTTRRPPIWIPTPEVCRLLGRSKRTVLRLAEQGVLTINRPGNSHPLFRRDEVVALAKANGLDVD